MFVYCFGSAEKTLDEKSKSFSQRNTFEGSRKDFNAAIDRICEYTGEIQLFKTSYFSSSFSPIHSLHISMLPDIDLLPHHVGTKIVFCELREPFIDNLYKPSVSQTRLEALIEPLDLVRT